jgi:hypothetical protein
MKQERHRMCVRRTRSTSRLRLVADNAAARRRTTITGYEIEAGDMTDEELVTVGEVLDLEQRLARCKAEIIDRIRHRRAGMT